MDAITRRELVRRGAGAGLAFGAGQFLPVVAQARPRGSRVAVLGGGVGGLSAAHELIERGFDVTVYERRQFGGKARSLDVPDTAFGGRLPLPGEHGMRFFPGFYTNLPHTMRRIPDGSNPNGTFDNLGAATQILFARDGGREDVLLPIGADVAMGSPDQLRPALVAAIQQLGALPPGEAEYFAERLLVFITSCDARRVGQWESQSWWDFVGAESRSEDYQRLLVNSVTRQILAAKAQDASARTLGLLWEAFLLNLAGRTGTGPFDRILDAPTDEAWLDPWVTHLRASGAKLRLGWTVGGLEVARGRIAGAELRDPRGRRRLADADWFVLALPVERARRVLGRAVRKVDPALERLDDLEVDWMNAAQIYLREPRPILHGHIFYCDSPWALSSLSQAQFWPERDFAATYGDGTVRDCVSVDIGDFHEPGVLYGKPAKDCTRTQIKREVLAQMRLHLDDTRGNTFPDEIIHSMFLDPGLVAHDGGVRSVDPLLINTPGALPNRPEASGAIPNLFLAADYVRVSVDVACMEGANEAARRAVNALLDASASKESNCEVFELAKAPEMDAVREVDAARYALGLPNALDVPR